MPITLSERGLRRLSAAVAVGLLAAHTALAVFGMRREAVTIAEYAHLPAGISHWQRGAFFVYCVNPPLVKMLAALPVLAARPKVTYPEPFAPMRGFRQEWSFGEQFMNDNRERYFDLFRLGRYPMVVLSVLGGCVVYFWSRQLYGKASGLVALALWCFCPNVLAYAGLITPDVGSAATMAAATFAYWHWLRRPTWRGALAAGALLGVAQLVKFTALTLYPVWLVLWVAWRLGDGRSAVGYKSSLAQLSVLFALSLVVLNLGYGGDGTGKRLGDFEFVSEGFTAEHMRPVPRPAGGEESITRYGVVRENRFRGSWLGAVPVPLPEHYVLGIDFQRRDFERPPFLSYLRGELRREGWWYYYLYALAVKTPVGTLVLLGLAAATSLVRRPSRVPLLWELPLLLPALAVLVLVSSQTGFSHHLRYVLPAWPFLLIWASRVGQGLDVSGLRSRYLLAGVVVACLTWNAAEAVVRYPHYLSYFNPLAGGPDNGGSHLINSNLDWGQDLLALRDWVDEHPEARPLSLVYFNFVDPSLAGISFHLPPILAPTQAEDPDLP